VRGASEDDIARILGPVESEVRKRLGNFVIAEDNATLEGEILDALAGKSGTVAVSELHTHGQIGGRLAACDGGRGIFRRGVIANDLSGIFAALDLRDHAGPVDQAAAEAAARGVMQVSGTDHGLAVLIAHGSDAGGGESDRAIFLAVASGDATVSRSAQIIGDEHRVRLGAVEMGLDCLRRHLQGLAFDERVDFEKSK
jgi:nicotinamide-nucleotide amidase